MSANILSWHPRAANWTSRAAGRPSTFIAAMATTGPLFHFSDTWQSVIHTGTTIITFLMVFLIQNTQDRDTDALQIKRDDEELDAIRVDYLKLARKARTKVKRDEDGKPQTVRKKSGGK